MDTTIQNRLLSVSSTSSFELNEGDVLWTDNLNNWSSSNHHRKHLASSSEVISTGSNKSVKKMNQSAPMNVPGVWVAMAKERRSKCREKEGHHEEEEEEEMVPPHEMVARRTRRMACSMVEGVGRTLKGRDLRQVRNAIWLQTGFLD